MLEPEIYRRSERLAKTQLPTWRVAQTHNVDHFERRGFPVRITSIGELGQLLDTMQENRFEKYMRELRGLTESEYALLIEVCRDAVLFQMTYLPYRQPILPISTLLSGFALYRKVLGIDPEFRSVLEIGPGCGYLSFFLRHHTALQNYSQIEACESFYILQNLVNMHCFGPHFEERAFVPRDASVLDYFSPPESRPDHTEMSPKIHAKLSRPLCSHYAWWRIGELITNDVKFQVVTSNANLLEFNQTALDDYLTLLHQVMEPAGVFIVQCTGELTGTLEALIDKIWAKGFATLMFVLGNKPIAAPQQFGSASLLAHFKGAASGTTTFAVNNCLFVKRGHPLFGKFRDRANCHSDFVGNEHLVNDVFFMRPPDRRMYSMQEFVEDTERSLAGLMERDPLPRAAE
jgi:hypothetical protein